MPNKIFLCEERIKKRPKHMLETVINLIIAVPLKLTKKPTHSCTIIHAGLITDPVSRQRLLKNFGPSSKVHSPSIPLLQSHHQQLSVKVPIGYFSFSSVYLLILICC